MTLKFHWFLPTYGDSRHLVGGGHGTHVTSTGGDRPATIAYLSQIARTAEQLGFEAALTPTGAWCEDAWLTTAMVARESERLKFLVAFRPGMTSPTLTAQMAATFQNLSGGRLLPYPHLEGAHHFGEGVSPLLVKRGLWTNPVPVAARASVPFGGQRAAS